MECGGDDVMLIVRALVGFAFLFVMVATAFFGSAGTLEDGRGWTMLAVFFGCAGLITIWLWFHDKALLERRVNAGPGSEPEPHRIADHIRREPVAL